MSTSTSWLLNIDNGVIDTLLAEFSSVSWSDCSAKLSDGPGLYVLVVTVNCLRFPIYVGQTGNIQHRFAEYCYSDWYAPTDFRVGSAVKYFSSLQASIELFFNEIPGDSASVRRRAEHKLIREFLLNGMPLLNSLSAYDYKTASRDDERKIVERFCDMATRRSRCW
jgi:hypothetical protein